MEFFDDAVVKAKEAINVACKKTNEVVAVQKQKFDLASLENKRAKDFRLLGEIYYNKIKGETPEDSSIADIVASINEKNEKIDELRTVINSSKNKRVCPKCAAVIDSNSNYCNVCGAKLTFTEETAEESDSEE